MTDQQQFEEAWEAYRLEHVEIGTPREVGKAMWQAALAAAEPAGEAVAHDQELPVRYYKAGGISYAVYGSSSIDYVEKLRAMLAAQQPTQQTAQVPDARLVESLEHAAKWIDELVEGHDRKHAWPSDFIDVAEQIRADLAEYRAAQRPKGGDQ